MRFQARIRRYLVDKDELRQGFVEEPLSTFDPQLTRLGDLRPALRGCLEAFSLLSTEPVQKPPYRSTVDFDAPFGKRNAQFVQSLFAMADIRSRNQSP